MLAGQDLVPALKRAAILRDKICVDLTKDKEFKNLLLRPQSQHHAATLLFWNHHRLVGREAPDQHCLRPDRVATFESRSIISSLIAASTSQVSSHDGTILDALQKRVVRNRTIKFVVSL